MPDTRDNLTVRELDILRLVAGGLSDKLIAVRLGIARSTVSNHVSTLLLKLRATNRTEVVAVAIRDGFIEVAPPRLIPRQ